jgi:hypothetical protein
MKDIKLPTIKLPSDMALCVDANGAICDYAGENEAGTRQVTAQELDRIVEHARYMHEQPKPPKAIKSVSGGHTVNFSVGNDGGDYDGKLGDVYIGCEHVPYAVVLRAQKASLVMRARKNRQQ